MAACRACPAQIRWVDMVDEHGAPKVKDGKPVRNPLDAEPLDASELSKLPADLRGAVARSHVTGHGMAVSAATIDDVRRWVQRGQASVHLSHFVTCPARDRFRRDARAEVSQQAR